MQRQHVFETSRTVVYVGPIPHIEFLFLLDGLDARRTKRTDAKATIKTLEDLDPALHGRKRDFQVFTQTIDREHRAYTGREAFEQHLNFVEMLQVFAIADVF